MDISKWKSVAVRKPDYDLLKLICGTKFRAPSGMIAKLVSDYVDFQAKKKGLSREVYMKKLKNGGL